MISQEAITILFLCNLIVGREESGSGNSRAPSGTHIPIHNLGTTSGVNSVDEKHDNIPDFIFY